MAQTMSDLKLYGFDAKLFLPNVSADLDRTALDFRENSPRASFFFIPGGLASCAGRLFVDINSSSFDFYAKKRRGTLLPRVLFSSKAASIQALRWMMRRFEIKIFFF